MDIRDKIWNDLLDTKHGDEYLVLYISRQRNIRKMFKIFTILLSTGGALTALQSFKIPTIIFCLLAAVVQILTSIENFIIHSEDDLDSLCSLRMKYFDRVHDLEILWSNLEDKRVTNQEATAEFFKLRKSASEIEKLDNKLHIKKRKKLIARANLSTNEYLNTYYYE